MITAKLTSNGQITIPKQIREKLGVAADEKSLSLKKRKAYFI